MALPQMTRFLRAKMVDVSNGKAAWFPSGVWFGTSKTDPGLDGVLTGEPTGNGYTRLALTANMGVADAAGRAKNTARMQFGTASGPWSDAAQAYWFTVDASTPGTGN